MNMKRSILHIVGTGELGGAERMLADLVRSQPEETHAIALFTPSEHVRSYLTKLPSKLFDRGRLLEGPIQTLSQSMLRGEQMWLEEVCKKISPEMVQVHTFGSQIVGTRLALRLGLPLIRTEHSTRVYDDRSCFPFSMWSLRQATEIVAVSKFLQGRVHLAQKRWAPKTPSTSLIYNGIKLPPLNEAPHPSAAEVAPKEGALRLLIVGRLDPRKGIDRAIEVTSRTRAATLDIMGEGAERSRLEAIVSERRLTQRVRFVPYSSDPDTYIHSYDAALVTSHTEGLGIAAIELLAHGLPVLGFAVGGIPEVVENGVAGRLVANGDMAGLTEVLRALENDRRPLHAFATKARRSVEKFAIETFADNWRRLYERVRARTKAAIA